jgi:single-stranded DNA-binding protein
MVLRLQQKRLNDVHGRPPNVAVSVVQRVRDQRLMREQRRGFMQHFANVPKCMKRSARILSRADGDTIEQRGDRSLLDVMRKANSPSRATPNSLVIVGKPTSGSTLYGLQ